MSKTLADLLDKIPEALGTKHKRFRSLSDEYPNSIDRAETNKSKPDSDTRATDQAEKRRLALLEFELQEMLAKRKQKPR